MVDQPLEWLDIFYGFGAKRIIFHYEVIHDKLNIISRIKKLNLSSGIAVNPSTQIKEFSHLVKLVDTVLFLSVNPGFYGSEFIPQVLVKIKDFKKLYPKKPIGIDGGVNKSNAKNISSLGLDFVCVGSAVLKSENPAQSYKELTNIVSSD